MTTPGGVPNLPQGALTLDTLGSKTQDMSSAAMKSRAAERISPIFGGSTGSDPMSSITPFGFLTGLFAGFQSTVASADPNDINGPEDLPGLLLDFIESLPVVGEFVRLLDAIKGTYEGDDETLQAVQAFFVSLREDIEQAQADADAAADKWAIAIDALFGGGHSVADFVDLLQGLRDGKVTALAPPNSNRLDNPSFDGQVSIDDPSDDFVWDPTVYRTPSPVLELSGSAKAIADGTDKELRSNLVGVAEGQIWTFVANLASVGLTGTGQLVQLTVLPYDTAGNELPPVVLADTGAPTAAVAWAEPPTGTVKGGQLLADWTIPAGVARVRLRMVLTANATAGSINLDDMNLSAKSLIPQYWVTDLTAALTGFTTWLTQIGQITSGQIVTAYNASVQQFKDWWNSNLGPAALQARTTQNAAWAARKAQNDKILNDWAFYYPFGSPSDTAATLVGGKRTKWGAWNDNIAIITEQLGFAPPTAPLVDISTKVSDNETATALAAATASAAGAAASLAQATNQDLTDKIVNASGTPGSGFTSADAYTGLTNFPGSNIVGQAVADVLYGAKGSSNSQQGNASSLSASETHAIAAGDLGVLVGLSYFAGVTSPNAATWNTNVTYGGVAMTKLTSVASSANSQGSAVVTEVWWLKSPPSGAQTVAATLTRASGSGTAQGLWIGSVSYSGSKVGSVTPNSGSATPANMSAPSASGRMVFGIYSIQSDAAATYNQTPRFNFTGTGSINYWRVGVVDAAGAAAVNFSASGLTGTKYWSGITVELTN